MDFVYFSPGYFHAREALFLYLAGLFDFKVVDVSCSPKNGTPTQAYVASVSAGLWKLRSGKLSRMRWYEPFVLLVRMIAFFAANHPKCVICATQFPLHSKFALLLKIFFRYKIAYVNEVWHSPSGRLGKINHALAGWMLRHADVILSEGQRSSVYVQKHWEVTAGKILMWPMMSEDIRNRVYSETFPYQDQFDQCHWHVKFGYVGRFVKEKGLRELLEAFSNNQRNFPKTALYLVGGNGDYEQTLRAEVEKINNCFVLSWVNPEMLSAVYRNLDCFVLPSYWDGFSTVCCEAASMKLPLIISEMVGCAPDLVIDGRNGSVVKARDAQALQSALAFWSALPNEERRSRGMESLQKFEMMNDYRNHANVLKKIKDTLL